MFSLSSLFNNVYRAETWLSLKGARKAFLG